MADQPNNKENVYMVTGSSAKEVYANLKEWQITNQKRLLQLEILKDEEDGGYICIFLSNPTEVTISGTYTTNGCLWVKPIT